MSVSSLSPRPQQRVPDRYRDKTRDGIQEELQTLVPVIGHDEAGNAEPRREPHRRPYDIGEKSRFQGTHPELRYRLVYPHLKDIPRLPQVFLRHRYSDRPTYSGRIGPPGIVRRDHRPLHDEGNPGIEEYRPDRRELFFSGNLDKKDVVRRERWTRVIIVAKIGIAFVTGGYRIVDKRDIAYPADRYSLTISRTTTRTKDDLTPSENRPNHASCSNRSNGSKCFFRQPFRSSR
jgi:hypothetical protein